MLPFYPFLQHKNKEVEFIMPRWLKTSVIALAIFSFIAVFAGNAAQAGYFKRLQELGEITLCADADFLPHSSSKMDPPGFDIEVAKAVAEKLGLQLKFKWVITRKGYRALRNLYSGECDFFMGLPRDEDFLDEYFRLDVTVPYYNGGFAVLARKDAKSLNLEDHKASGVGVQMGTVPDFRLFEYGFERKLYRNMEEIEAALKSGEASIVVAPALEAAWVAKSNPDLGLTVLAETKKQFIYPLGFGVRKKEPDVRKAIDGALADLKNSGRLEELREKYGLPNLVAENDGGGAGQPKQDGKAKKKKSEAPPQSNDDEDDTIDLAQLDEEFPSDPKSVDKGRKLYKQACYKCHGPNGVSGGIIPDLRKFRGNHYEMFAIIQAGRLEVGMPAWNEYLNVTEIKQIIVYLKSLPED